MLLIGRLLLQNRQNFEYSKLDVYSSSKRKKSLYWAEKKAMRINNLRIAFSIFRVGRMDLHMVEYVWL